MSLKRKLSRCFAAAAAATAAASALIFAAPANSPTLDDFTNHQNTMSQYKAGIAIDKNAWRIVLAEQPLGMGEIDNFLFGKDSCHAFFALIAPDGRVVAELHGMAYDLEKDDLQNTDSIPSNLLNIFTHSLHIPDHVRRNMPKIGHLDNTRLVAVPTNGEWRMDFVPRENIQTVFAGSKAEATEKFIAAINVAEEFNKLDLSYVLASLYDGHRTLAIDGGQNSNSVARLLAKAMDLHLPESTFKLKPSGYANDFARTYPHLLAAADKQLASDDLNIALLEAIYRKGSMYYKTNDPGHPPPEPPEHLLITLSTNTHQESSGPVPSSSGGG